jgi:hypothetical protein
MLVQSRDKQAADTDTKADRATVLKLLEKQQQAVHVITSRAVSKKMLRGKTPEERLLLIISVVQDGIKPLPLSLADRRAAVRDAAKDILGEIARAKLAEHTPTDDIRPLLLNLGARLSNSPTTWDQVLPVGVRYEVLKHVLERHLETVPETHTGVRDTIAFYLAKWASFEGEQDFPSG